MTIRKFDYYMKLDRRDFLKGTGVASITALAGCSSPDAESDDGDSNDIAPPVVPSTYLSGWTMTEMDSQSFSTTGVNGAAKTRMYENTKLRQEVKTKTLDSFDQTLAMSFASHIDLEGLATGLATPKKIASEIQPTLKSRMENAGIQNIRTVSVGNPRPQYSNNNSTVREYLGEFEVPAFEQTAEINGEQRTIELSGGTLPVTGLLSVWKTKSGVAFAGGGAFPNTDYERSDRLSVTGKEGDGIDVGIFVDLNLNPEQLREQIIDIAENIQTE